MKPRNYLLSIIICLCIFAFVFATSGCKSNNVTENREAYEESIGAGGSSDGDGDDGGDDGGDGGSSSDDHSNYYSGATSMSTSDSQSGTIETGGDMDWFKVYLSSAGELNVYSTGSTDVKATLYNSSQTELANDDDGGDSSNFSITEDVTNAGYYYIKVEAYSSTATGSYTIFTSFTADSSGGTSSSRYYDFETGGVAPSDLYNSTDSDATWAVRTTKPFGGSYSLESGSISHSQKSCFQATGSWSSGYFYYYTSTELADRLKFYIDGTLQNSPGYSGTSSGFTFTSFTFSTYSSSHVYKWCYEKDYSVSTGDDTVWIDNLSLTP
jgi:hypothetical protein